MHRTGVIYLATINADVDKCYIGYTVDFEKRKQTHLQTPKDCHFHNAIRKYGADTVTWQILEEDIPEHRLPDREELWIAFYNTYHNGLNMTEGGEVSQMLSPKVRAKLSATMREKAKQGTLQSQTPEWKAKMRAWTQNALADGTHPSQSPERNAKIREAQLAKAARGEISFQNPENRAKAIAASSTPEVRAKAEQIGRAHV